MIKPLIVPEGLGTSGVLVMAESLGEHEEKDRLPLRPHAEAGSLFERALWRAGIPRESLTITNLVWYRPPGNRLAGMSYEMDAIRACSAFNEELVEKVKPKAILALGGLAYRELTGLTGHKTGITQVRGMITTGSWFKGIPVIGTYHPSFLRRGSKERSTEIGPKVDAAGGGIQGMALMGVLIRDLQLALKVARDGAPEFKFDDYKLGATLNEWGEFYREARDNPHLPISYDWETPRSIRELSEDEIEAGERERDITQGQMSLRPGQAIVSEFTPDLIPIWRDILNLPNPKLDWNGRKFDRPEGATYGLTFNGELHDLMDFWHHTQPDLPRGLQYAASFFVPEVGPWKHLIYDQPLYYGALDVDIPQRIYAGLVKTSKLLREPHSGRSLWDGYHEQIVRLAPVLDRMSSRGMPVSEPSRLALSTEFVAAGIEIDARLQGMVPEEIRNVEPKEGFKRNNRLPLVCLEAAGQCGLFDGVIRDNGNDPNRSSRVESKIQQRVVDPETNITYVTREFKDEKTKLPVQRWARLLPFKTGSDQVKKYIKWQQGQEVEKKVKKWIMPISPKDGKETSDKLGLHKLVKATNDPVIKLVLESREIHTAQSTFVEGWKPDLSGRVHSIFGFKPATGQLSSQSPNAQNFPKHAKIARAMNRMLKARPRHRFVSLDWKSFHVLTTGFEAQDPLYMRMSRLDMHSFFALVGLLRLEQPEKLIELPDDELGARLAWYREQKKVYSSYASQGFPGGMTFSQIRDKQAKPTILGVGFGQQAPGMFKRNPDSFANLKAAKECSMMLNRIFPLPEAWRKAVRLEADVHAHLLTRFGYVRWFWDVFSRKIVADNFEPKPGQIIIIDKAGRRIALGPGDDAEAVVAFRPANDAFGIKRQVMVEIGEAGLDEKYQLINEIHDCLRFECPDHFVDECLVTVKGMMERPSSILVDPQVAPGGLWCQVDVEMSAIEGNLDKRDASNPIGMEKVKI